MADAITKVLNMDVWSISRKLVRMMEETTKSQSSNVLGLHPADVSRFTSYLTDLNGLVDHIQRNPVLDLPETTPKEYDVGAMPEATRVENEALVDMQVLINLAWNELCNSQSIRYGCRLLTFDEARLRAILAKITSLLAYAAEQYPLDMPESTPRAEISGPGRTGIQPAK
jgi:hypothetical protein